LKVYLSSTFLDLQDHRERVAGALRKAKYDVVMMEEYVTRDELVEIACQGDVTGCDAYLGLFAWRYGYIPEDNNPERQSVTDCLRQNANPSPAWFFSSKTMRTGLHNGGTRT
jgi:hypothetical protein